MTLRKIEVLIFGISTKSIKNKISLFKDEKHAVAYEIVEERNENKVIRLTLKLAEDIVFGSSYEVIVSQVGRAFVDVTDAVDFECFEEAFNYDGDDLGPTYTKEYTDFALWAPLASDVMIFIKLGDKQAIKQLRRSEKGVYRIRLQGDLENAAYHYLVTNSGVQRIAKDPYAKSVTLNSEYSAVINLDNVKKMDKKVRFNPNISKLESIIYELSVRDFTIQRSNDVLAHGKFLGLVEENRLTLKGEKAGLDYLSDLGVTHVQLLPVLDFAGVDDLDIRQSYNWGYDNISFFALEGSYAVDPIKPSARLLEFKEMVNKLHDKKLGVILDVVYNHVFNYENSDLEKIVPSYFFRRNSDGEISNGSQCGNDFASERFMGRKLIVDSAYYLVEMFDIDGFRFDLLGLIDKKTIDELKTKILKIKPSAIFYGEGWNILTPLEEKEKVTIENAFINPDFSFFNDTFRDIIKGSAFDVSQKGYIGGEESYKSGVIYSMLGSSYKTIYGPRFLSPEQSINYVECHDNHTLFDKLVASNPEEDEETILKRVRLGNALVLLALGVPFIHMGQEIGLTKYGQNNTYNFLDRFNQMDYKMVERRQEMVQELKSLIALRKMITFYKEKEVSKILPTFTFAELDHGALVIKKENAVVGKLKGDLLFVINPSTETLFYNLKDYYCLLSAYEGEALCDLVSTRNLTIPPISYRVLLKTNPKKERGK